MFTMQLVYTKLSESSKRVEIKLTVDVYHVDPGCGSNRRFVLEAKTIEVRLKPDGTNYINKLDVKLNPPQIKSLIGTEPTEFQPNPALVAFSDGKQMEANWILKQHNEQEAAIVRQERLIAAMGEIKRTTEPLNPHCQAITDDGVDFGGGGGDVPRYELWNDGDIWKIIFDGRTAEWKDEKGLHYVPYLLKNPPGEPIHGVKLAARVFGYRRGFVLYSRPGGLFGEGARRHEGQRDPCPTGIGAGGRGQRQAGVRILE